MALPTPESFLKGRWVSDAKRGETSPEVATHEYDKDIAARVFQWRVVFKDTGWYGSLEKISNFQKVRPIVFEGDRSIILIMSRRRKRDAYHLAVLVADYLILEKPDFAERNETLGI